MKSYILTSIFVLILIQNVSGVNTRRDLLDRIITIEFKKVPLEDALDKVSEKGGFSFSYNPSIIDFNQLISLKVQNTTIEQILLEMFGSAYDFKQVGDTHIIIRDAFSLTIRPMEDKRRLTPQQQARLKEDIPLVGQVVDEKTGKGIENVVIYDEQRKMLTLTDSLGYYKLDVPVEYLNKGVYFRGRGYYDTMVQFDPDKEEKFIKYNIALTPYNNFTSPVDNDLALNGSNPYTLGFVQRFVPKKVDIISNNLDQTETRVFQFTLVPFLSNANFLGGSYVNKVSLNTFMGYSAGVEGIEIGGLVNINRYKVTGVQIGGLANIVGGNVKGVQIGGITNYNMNKVDGLSVGGIFNMAKDSTLGMHVGGIVSMTRKNVYGLQIGGILAAAKTNVHGMQLSGIYNYAESINGMQVSGITSSTKENINGMQLAGISNYGKNINGAQVSGIFNIVSDTTKGAQIAGIYNRSEEMNGLQIGLVNYAKKGNNSIPIGLFSWYDDGYHSAEYSVDEFSFVNFAFRSGSKRFYNYYQFGYQFNQRENLNEGLSFGGGVGTFIGNRINIEGGIHSFYQIEEDQFTDSYVRVALMYAQPIGKTFTFVIGPTANYQLNFDDNTLPFDPPSFYTYHTNNSILWISAKAALRINF
ncbi:STN domain-containing protein [Flammeovirga agarivorans]|uniref:Secretin/TonB short N-terminal domain-containing protein n=1 Tax=Flammeovirga agarivorans TaxID=2726742 RepID=A0A7X8SHA4_9BACT|nr:STN domain-containing protein [Flammeovirga agarivorans]NLR90205.1 hypothetical protein [Flammeovirga agarivorans]